MSETEVFIELPGSEYGDGIIINKYKDQYSLVAARKSKDGGTNYMQWGFPQGPDKKPKEKSIPWKVNLGTREDAIHVLTQIAREFGLELCGSEEGAVAF